MPNMQAYARKLITTFPNMQTLYDRHMADYGELLGHIFFADAVNEPLMELLRVNENPAAIGKYISLLENMYINGDDAVQNVVVVSVLERLGDDETVLRNAYGYFSEPLKPGFTRNRNILGPQA